MRNSKLLCCLGMLLVAVMWGAMLAVSILAYAQHAAYLLLAVPALLVGLLLTFWAEVLLWWRRKRCAHGKHGRIAFMRVQGVLGWRCTRCGAPVVLDMGDGGDAI